MNQNELSSAIKAAIEAVVPTLSVGIGEAPSESPVPPYAIIYPLGAARIIGSWKDPEDTVFWWIQVRAVGMSHHQTGWVQEKVRSTIMDRDPGGQYSNSLAVDGLEPEFRKTLLLGQIVQADTELHSSDDRYEFRRPS